MDTAGGYCGVDPAPGQLCRNHVVGMGRGQLKGLRRLGILLDRLKRRRSGPAFAQGFHGLHKADALYLCQVVKRRFAAYTPACPMPKTVADFQAVMGSGAVFIRAASHKLLGLIGLQVGKQVYFLCLCYLSLLTPGMGASFPRRYFLHIQIQATIRPAA